MRKKIIIANWKMNPATAGEAAELAEKIERAAAGGRRADIVVAPSFPYLTAVGAVLSRARLGAQDAFWKESGPYTGEVSARQLKNLGVKYVLIGHSERRVNLGETDEMIAKKIAAVAATGMTAILCIGERHRTGNDIPTEVGMQFKSALSGLKKSFVKNVVVCYEPVWAISTMPGARPAKPDDALRANIYIRKIIGGMFGPATGRGTRVIYGGSVNAKNIAGFLASGGMDGALVGAASLDPQEFARLIASVV